MPVADRITFLINSLSGGGAEGVCVNLANGFAQRGWRVTLVVLHLENAIRKEDLCQEVKLVVLGKKHARNALVALWRFLRVHKLEKILVFNHQLAIGLVIIRFFSGSKFSIISRNINTITLQTKLKRSFWHKYIVGNLVRILYKFVDHVIAQSAGMKKDLIINYNFKDIDVTVINNPVSQDIENTLQNIGQNRCEKDDYLLCVGRLEQQKAFHFALEAFSLISSEFPQLRLKFVGEGSQKKCLLGLAESLGVANRVDFEGFRKDIIPYYLHARITVLTSLYEGFPNVLVESICLGTPVVAFDCPCGPNEIVSDGITGFLVQCQNVDQLAAKLKRALTHNWDQGAMLAMIESYKRAKVVGDYIRVCSAKKNRLKRAERGS